MKETRPATSSIRDFQTKHFYWSNLNPEFRLPPALSYLLLGISSLIFFLVSLLWLSHFSSPISLFSTSCEDGQGPWRRGRSQLGGHGRRGHGRTARPAPAARHKRHGRMARPSPAVVHRRHSQPRQPSHGRWSGRSLRQARAARPAPTAGHGQRVLMMGRPGTEGAATPAKKNKPSMLRMSSTKATICRRYLTSCHANLCIRIL